MNPPPREPVKQWLTVAKNLNGGDQHEEHETEDVAGKYIESMLLANPDAEVCRYKFEGRFTARLVIEQDGGRTAT